MLLQEDCKNRSKDLLTRVDKYVILNSEREANMENIERIVQIRKELACLNQIELGRNLREQEVLQGQERRIREDIDDLEKKLVNLESTDKGGLT